MNNGMQSSALNLCPGFQRVIITQDNLCFYADSVFIPAPDRVEIDTGALQDVTCFGASDGLISINGAGGSGGYTYVWTIPGSGPIQSGIPAGTYGVTVTDAAGCTIEHVLNITEPDSLVVQIDTLALRPITCNFANSGSISLTVAGGDGGYLFNWNPNVSSDFIANGIAAGLYQITVTDAAGCTDTTSILMTGPQPVVSFLPMIDGAVCFGGLAEVTVDSAVGGNGGYTWSVNGGQPHELDSIVLLPAGIYNIITQDSTGCRDTIQIILDNPPPLEITIVPANPVIDLGDSVRLEVAIVGNLTSIDSVSWNQVGVLSCYDCADPLAMNVVPTVYTVTVWDDNGCTAQLEVLVDVDNHREVFIPNVFSPNFDGRNDQLLLFTGQGITSIPSIRIFDRWGELMRERLAVFPADGGIEVWDGSFHGKMMAPGVYVYVIEVRFADNQTLTYRGDITLLR
jgi:gliding motility-associated-like protein